MTAPARSLAAPLRVLCALLIALGLGACSGSAHDQLTAAQEALADADYSEAISAAEDGLGAGPDEVTAWGLELVKLEALARSGRGDETLALLQKLASERPASIPVSQYSATADQLRVAGPGAGLDPGAGSRHEALPG